MNIILIIIIIYLFKDKLSEFVKNILNDGFSINKIFSGYYSIISLLLIFGFANLKYLKKSHYYPNGIEENNFLINYNTQQNYQPYMRPNLSENRRNIIAARQSWCCNHCQNMLDTYYKMDYVIPLHKGGQRENDNIQALCSNCSNKKQALDLSF